MPTLQGLLEHQRCEIHMVKDLGLMVAVLTRLLSVRGAATLTITWEYFRSPRSADRHRCCLMCIKNLLSKSLISVDFATHPQLYAAPTKIISNKVLHCKGYAEYEVPTYDGFVCFASGASFGILSVFVPC
ncbi:hypothetical protein CEXT_170531 [Caerostris extrusa]|uniref:Uncharacterized protein n=1 Tax=Caerostris extrusa TaxID=172846 RepID=A0AAV4MA06_CAEEX|nr:hypothetical protein CEXT_170531 [Caerostris extrusa]